MLLILWWDNETDSITDISSLEYLMLYGVAREATSAEIVYKEFKKLLIDLLLKLQLGDTST